MAKLIYIIIMHVGIHGQIVVKIIYTILYIYEFMSTLLSLNSTPISTFHPYHDEVFDMGDVFLLHALRLISEDMKTTIGVCWYEDLDIVIAIDVAHRRGANGPALSLEDDCLGVTPVVCVGIALGFEDIDGTVVITRQHDLGLIASARRIKSVGLSMRSRSNKH